MSFVSSTLGTLETGVPHEIPHHDYAPRYHQKYIITNFLMNGLKTSFMCLMKVLGAIYSPKTS